MADRTDQRPGDGSGASAERCRAGLQFGSRMVGGLMPGHVADYLPEAQLMEVKNLREFAGDAAAG